MPLETDNRMEDPDRIYRMLIDAHRGLTDEESAVLNTRLVLILANQLADETVIAEAVALAKADMGRVTDRSAKDTRGADPNDSAG